jgi:hypothetical protein
MRVLHEGPYGAFTFLAGTTTPAFTTSSELRIADALLPLSGAVLLISARPGLLTAVGARTGDLTTFFASGDVLSRITCGCTAARIVPVGRAGSFGILRDSREGTLWIADFGRTAELYFVPRPAERVLFSGEHDAMN